ncbi:PREDICTED: 3-oxo-5-alpha-steroid 4-dehydrogenase 1 [Nanorana parkeri]|uniref:3-oxo-5-alpha-steroid 4-dehydrogenase 1 n=1 Tax=Nanorana parkeri TaxID=125878 RepID=UPI000854EC10|nr:PREDICTED: 3-oxo-5-alpha-steroid 4-dehydrogenase 1 [Nanorana parkeri]
MTELLEDEARLLDLLSLVMVLMGLLSFAFLRFIRMPYGRYASSTFGPPIPVRLAWFIQELPSLVVSFYYVSSQPELPTPALVLMGFFICHYIQRTLIFPFLIRGGKPTPLASFALAFTFCCYNGYLQSSYLCKHATLPSNWTHDPRFIAGSVLFFCGMFINVYSDHILRNLRKPGETGYKIPHGGLFEYVSGANFFGEIVEWSGFAVAGWSTPGAAFAIFTVLVLLSRAQQHHQWYLEKFDNYPKSRKILVPFVY